MGVSVPSGDRRRNTLYMPVSSASACARMFTPQSHVHDQHAHNAPRIAREARDHLQGATFATRMPAWRRR
jgi:hypothetical protein